MRKLEAALLLAMAGSLSTTPAAAQAPFRLAIEGRVAYGSAFGLWNLNGDIERGLGGGVNLQAWASNRVALVAGWETITFKVDRPDLEQGVESFALDKGFRLGILTSYPLSWAGSAALFGYAGGIYNKTASVIEAGRESFIATSNNGLGYEAGTVITLPIRPNYVITPGVRYRTHKASFGPPDENGPNETTLEYLVVDIGLRLNL